MTDDFDEKHRNQTGGRTSYELPSNAPARRRASLIVLILGVLFLAALIVLVFRLWHEPTITGPNGQKLTPPAQDLP